MVRTIRVYHQASNHSNDTRKGAILFKKRLFLALLATVLSTIFNNFAVIILVHGSLAAKETWWHEDCKNQNFYAILSQESAKYGYGMVVPFSWSGIPEESEINRAADLLAPLITSYASEPLKIGRASCRERG